MAISLKEQLNLTDLDAMILEDYFHQMITLIKPLSPEEAATLIATQIKDKRLSLEGVRKWWGRGA
jgi:hypothetical protein